jgi:hypothetical protein
MVNRDMASSDFRHDIPHDLNQAICLHHNQTNVVVVRLRLSVKSASQPAVFFSYKKSANSTFSQPDQPKRTGQIIRTGYVQMKICTPSFL